MGAFWVWFGKDNPPEKPVPQLIQAYSGSLQRTTPVKKPAISSVPGIPLSNISEKARLQISHDQSTENQSPKLVNDNTEIERKKVAKNNSNIEKVIYKEEK